MRVCVLLPSYEQSTSELRERDTEADPSPYLVDHDVEKCFLHKATAAQRVEELVERNFDVFLNLCDGAMTEDCAGIEVAQTLERLGLPFTGARAHFFDPTREDMKRACNAFDIATPRYVISHDAHDAQHIANELTFPLIVKHPHGYSSIGLSRASRVETRADLAKELAAMIHAYGSALVEEFIEGREFTVLIAEPGDGESEPRAYTPLEIAFPPGESFKHFDLKWIHYEDMSWIPVTDQDLCARLIDLSRRFFVALGGTGYGRCDLRSDARGNIYILEINPNCGLFYPRGLFGSADLILDSTPGGHVAFTDHIIECARRHAGPRPD